MEDVAFRTQVILMKPRAQYRILGSIHDQWAEVALCNPVRSLVCYVFFVVIYVCFMWFPCDMCVFYVVSM